MPIFKEIPPTAGWKFSVKDMFVRYASTSLENDFRNYLNASDVHITYSGTAGLYIILESLKKLSSKRTIVIPSYVCPLVALAAIKSGLRIKVCDIAEGSFDFNYTHLKRLCAEDKDILAIVAIHLGGIAVDFDKIKELATKYQIFTIEDCAHALGARYKGRKCGTLGDFSFFSLCRGKGLSIYEGGVLAVNRDEYSYVIKDSIKQVVRNNYFSEAFKIIELMGYWLFYRPQLFWFVFKLPQIFWNIGKNYDKAFGEEYDANFDTHAVSGFRKFLGHKSFYRLEDEVRRQRERASFYIESLKGLKGVRVLREDPNTYAAYPFVTVLFDEAEKRNKFFKKINKNGLGVSIVYLNAICDYSYLKDRLTGDDCISAREFSKRQLTLTTSIFLKDKDALFIVNSIREVLAT